MNILIFSNDVTRALAVQDAITEIPVNLTVIVDIERDGKAERQDQRSFISNHELSDIKVLKQAGLNSVIARVNKFGINTPYEIETAIQYGAQGIMLPFFKYPYEVKETFDIVSGRVQLIPLFETVESIFHADKIFDLVNFPYFHIGLNDLSLQLRANSMFELINTSIFKKFCEIAIAREKKYGVGGVGNPFDITMDIAADEVIKVGANLGAIGWILSRQFFKMKTSDYRMALIKLYRSYLFNRCQYLGYIK